MLFRVRSATRSPGRTPNVSRSPAIRADAATSSSQVRRSPSRTTASSPAARSAARSGRRPRRKMLISKPQEAGDDLPLHLGRAGVDRATHGVAQLALDPRLDHVAVAAVDLDGVERALDVSLADEQLGDRSVEDRALPLFFEPAGPVEQPAPRLNAHLRVDQLVGDRRVLGNRPAELLPAARVADRLLEL